MVKIIALLVTYLMANGAIISSKASLLVSSMQDLQVVDFAGFQIFLSCHYLKHTVKLKLLKM